MAPLLIALMVRPFFKRSSVRKMFANYSYTVYSIDANVFLVLVRYETDI